MDYPQWTKDSINCYELNCDCSKCLLAKILETNCILNLTVKRNLQIIGEPTEENTQKDREPHKIYKKRISKYDLVNRLKLTSKKEAAKYFSLSMREMSELMKAYSINGNSIRYERERNIKGEKSENI